MVLNISSLEEPYHPTG